MDTQPAKIVSSHALELTDAAERQVSDLVAALASSLGHRHRDVVGAITAACQSHLGCWQDSAAASPLADGSEPFSAFADTCVVPSASEANEWAIRISRSVGGLGARGGLAASGLSSEGRGGSERHRIVTLLGGDHGDTLACRSANGRVADQAIGGPLAPGFRHVAPGDVRALQQAVDSTAAAVLLSPLDWNRGGEPFDSDYLLEARRICDANGALLVIDETRLPTAISGHWFFHQSHPFDADIVTASAGWTGGLPGGLVLVNQLVIDRLESLEPTLSKGQEATWGSAAAETGGPFSLRGAGLLPSRDYPVLRAIIEATATAIQQQGGPEHVRELAGQWADAWQNLTDGFEFISQTTTIGLLAVVHLDLPANDVVAAASRLGLRLLASGDTTLLACLPVNVSAQEITRTLGTLRNALETIERQTIES